MATIGIEDEEEFEDAMEPSPSNRHAIPPSPVPNIEFVHPQNMIGTPRRPAELNVASEWNRTAPLPRQRMSQSNVAAPRPLSSHFHTPGSQSARDTSHRDRLIALRRRMNIEFGGREVVPSNSAGSEADEAMSTLSEAASLQSWQQNMIYHNETLVVNASDSRSTCALSMPPSSVVFETFEHFKSPQVPLLRDPQKNQDQSSSWTTPDLSSVTGSISPGPSSSQTPISPPPVPSRETLISTRAPPPRMPPPLPPRNPSMRLPNPIAFEVETRLRNIEEEKENSICQEKKSPCEQPAASVTHTRSSKSNDSITSNTDESKNGSIKKCHAKSNSLDRGLTLAKAIKTGPFPPPANKSSSLTRQEANGEEDIRNCIAEGVVREITTSLESSFQEQDILETITSTNTSSVSTPSTSTDSRKNRTEKYVRENNRMSPLVEDKPCSSKTISNLEAAASLSPAKIVRADDRRSRSMSNDELSNNNRSLTLSSSFDPIALDVERRLSMKRDGKAEDDRTSMSLSDDGASRMSVALSSIGTAKSLARNSVMYASGFFRGALQKVRNVTHSGTVSARSELGDETSEGEESEGAPPTVGSIVRPRKSKKGPFDFEHVTVEQEINNEHTGAVWCIKFSLCGRLMATAGQDSILRVWVVRSHLKYFSDMRDKYTANMEASSDPMSQLDNIDQFRPPSSLDSMVNSDTPSEEDSSNLFCSKPFAVLKGHTSDILDLSWSKNYFILSSGMDRTVKLWHLSRGECLCCFQHIDFVTCVAFLPKDDRYFLSGSLDGKLRLWHIPDKKVAVWNEVQVKFITAITFVKNGKFAVVGTYNGRCYFYTTDQLKYHTVVDVRSSRGKNAKGHKVTGLAVHGDKLLVTSNDSRIRMYDIRDKALTCKFRGVQNDHSQIRAAFSPDGRHIICGSEDKYVYLWRTGDMPSGISVRKDRNSMWERVRTHNAPVSVAVFAPRPQVFFSMLERNDKKSKADQLDYENIGQSDSINSNGSVVLAGHAIVSADLQGSIKIMVNRPRQCKAAPSAYHKSSVSSYS